MTFTFNPFTGNLDKYTKLDNPMQFKGSIAVNTDFPLIADVENGWFYTITADVTDDAGVTYTNTGQSFSLGDEIAWNGTNWTLLGGERNISPQNTVQVDLGGTVIAGEVYTTIADALTYIATQTPAEDNRWCLKLGAGEYTENFNVPNWVWVKGTGNASTILTGEVRSAGYFAVVSANGIAQNVIEDCQMNNLIYDTEVSMVIYNCRIMGGSDTAGAATQASMITYDCMIAGGVWDNMGQIQVYRGFILGGTFSPSTILTLDGCSIVPYENVTIGNGLIGNIFNTSIWYNFSVAGGDTHYVTFSNAVQTINLYSVSYLVDATLGVTAPEFDTANRTYNFYNCSLGDATYTAGTFNHYGTAESDENLFEKISLGSGTSINEFSTDGTLVDDSDDAVPTEKAVKTYVDAQNLWEIDGTETQLKTADEIDMQDKNIINVLDPVNDQDAATKKYVDDENLWETSGTNTQLKTATDINVTQDKKIYYDY